MAEAPNSAGGDGSPGGKRGDAGDGDRKKEPGVGEQTEKPQSTTEWLASQIRQTLHINEGAPKPEQVLDEVSVDGVIQYIKSKKCKKIITMAGAGISTSAGIPDFRSPDTGLYANLEKYNLPHPQAVFDITYFREHPEPFFRLAKELYPGVFKPTPCHYFLRLLNEKGLLLRHYTQNIDTLERVAGLAGDTIVEAHGTFHTAHCIGCQREYSQDFVKEQVFADEVPRCTKEGCGNIVKPDIVFFGEALPARFFQCVQTDFRQCDLLVVMGTSLVVQPFASLATKVPEECPRLYINLEKASGGDDPILALLGMGSGFMFDAEDNYRDVFWQGTCDDGCYELAEKLGWKDDLVKLVTSEHSRIDASTAAGNKHTGGGSSPKSDKSSPKETSPTKKGPNL